MAKYVLDIVGEVTAPIRLIIEMIGLVMALVVIMSMMGLIGMSIHYTNERKNEIAVRRIFGATGIASVLGICVAELVRKFFIELGSVLWQTLRAARTNPAEALKKE